jgi:ectoine hydroxylase-related dioxygenase (phytanoyl-CoA dioxygenase family)
VRLYHDQALFKEPHGGHTPWHADQQYWPLDRDTTCTAWVPLQEVPMEMGPLEFAVGSHRCAFGRDLEIGDESERVLARSLKELPHEARPFALGEISFHAGWTFHRARENDTDRMRAVMTVIYMEDGTRLREPANANQRSDWERWMPGARIDEPIATHLNPVLWSRREVPTR